MSAIEGRLRSPVLVVGAYGYGNVGDEAILSGLLARLGGHAVTVVSRSPTETSALHGVQNGPSACTRIASERSLGCGVERAALSDVSVPKFGE